MGVPTPVGVVPKIYTMMVSELALKAWQFYVFAGNNNLLLLEEEFKIKHYEIISRPQAAVLSENGADTQVSKFWYKA